MNKIKNDFNETIILIINGFQLISNRRYFDSFCASCFKNTFQKMKTKICLDKLFSEIIFLIFKIIINFNLYNIN